MWVQSRALCAGRAGGRGAALAAAAVALGCASSLRGAAAQAVDLNPQEDLPFLGPLLGGGDEDESPVHRRWSFWLIISVVCAFTIVVVYFAWRGFRAHWRGAAAVAAERESELAARPPAFPHGDLDAAELARRTGRSSGDVAAKLLLRKESAAAQQAAAAAADAVA